LDYYAILGVHPTAEDIVIRAAYKALAQRYHPDRFAGSPDEAHRRMSDLTKAYEVLADPVRRQKYDRRRLTYTQSVATYFNSSPRDTPPALDPLDLRSAAAKRKRSRLALSALMVAVVALSIFNLFQYSPQLKERLSASAPVPAPPADARSRRATDASITGAVTAAPGDLPQVASPVKPRNLPIGQGSVSAPDATVPDTQAPAPLHANAATESRPVKGPGEIAPRPSGTESGRAAAALGTALPAVAPLPKDERRARTTLAGARAAPADGRISTPPPAPASDPCRDSVAALGLCSPNTTARNK
jgi:hypothetical protein